MATREGYRREGLCRILMQVRHAAFSGACVQSNAWGLVRRCTPLPAAITPPSLPPGMPGHHPRMAQELQKMLKSLGVRFMLLPAVPSVVGMWCHSFGFTPLR